MKSSSRVLLAAIGIMIACAIGAPPLHAQFSVTPYGTQTGPEGLVTFTIYNDREIEDTSVDSFDLTCDINYVANNGCSADAYVSVWRGSSAEVDVSYAVYSNAQAQVGLTAYSPHQMGSYDRGYYTIPAPPPPPPTILTAAVLSYGTDTRFRVPRICAPMCGDAAAAYSTPSYTSLDVPRSIGLSYNSGTVTPRGFVHVIATDTSSDGPTKMSLRLQDSSQAWVTFTNSSTELFFGASGGQNHLAGQFTIPSGTATLRTYTAVVKSFWNDTTRTVNSTVSVATLDETSSPYGAGWRISGLSRIYATGQTLLVTDGAGGVIAASQTSCNGGGTCFYGLPVWEYGQLSKRPSVGQDGVLYDRTYPNGSVARYSSAGLLTEVSDRYGNTTSYAYDGSLRLTSVTDPANQTSTLSYRQSSSGGWKAGTLESITTPGGRVSRFFVDTLDNLLKVEDPDSVAAFIGMYDSSHRLTSATERGGADIRLTYDFAGTLSTDSTPAVSVVGNSSPIRFGTSYRSLKRDVMIDPATGAGTATNPAARLSPDSVRLEVRTMNGQTTRYAVNAFGAHTRVELPLGQPNVLTRTDGYHITTEITSQGDTVDHSWEYPGNIVLSHHRNTEAQVAYFYDSTRYFQLVRVVGAGVDSVWNYYATNGNLDSTRVGSATNTVKKFTYNSRGFTTSSTDEMGHPTYNSIGSSGFQNTDSTRVGTGARVTRFAHDAYGRVWRTIDPTGRTDSVTYDVLNRIRSEHGPAGHQVLYKYRTSPTTPDSVVDALGQVHQTYSNALGWVVRQIDPNGRDEFFRYDTAGNAVEWTNRRGQTTSFEYDSLARVTKRTLADGRITTYWYGVDSTRRGASNNESSDEIADWSYPGVVAKSHVTDRPSWGIGGFFVASRIDSLANRTSTEWIEWHTPTWTTRVYNRIERNERGLVTRLGPPSKPTYITYDADGKAETINRYGQTGQQLTHRVTDAMIGSTGSAEMTASFAHDLLQRVTERRSANADTLRAFAYDSVGRLQSAATRLRGSHTCTSLNALQETDPRCSDDQPFGGSTIQQWSYGYDAVGNPSTGTVATGNRLTYVAETGDSLQYDYDGNLTRKWRSGFDQRLYWNSINQLDSVWTSGLGTVSFGYDGFGRRVRKTTPAKMIRYIYFEQQVVAELDSAGVLQRSYSHFPGVDQPLAVETSAGTVYHYVTDHLGNVTALKDTLDSNVATYTYTPFGAEVTSTGTFENPIRFAGREYDAEMQLYYNRARYYDPAIRRFVSEDPIGLRGGVNVYTYAGNDPVNSFDPSGLEQCIRTVSYWHPANDEYSKPHQHDYEYLVPCFAGVEGVASSRSGSHTTSLGAWLPEGWSHPAYDTWQEPELSIIPEQEQPPPPWEPMFTPVGSRARPEYAAFGIGKGVSLDPVIAANARLADKPGVVAFLLMTRDAPAVGQLTPSYTGTLFFSGQAWGVTYKPRVGLTRFHGRLTRPKLGAEVAHEIQADGRISRAS